jgi:hypothetical protein
MPSGSHARSVDNASATNPPDEHSHIDTSMLEEAEDNSATMPRQSSSMMLASKALQGSANNVVPTHQSPSAPFASIPDAKRLGSKVSGLKYPHVFHVQNSFSERPE